MRKAFQMLAMLMLAMFIFKPAFAVEAIVGRVHSGPETFTAGVWVDSITVSGTMNVQTYTEIITTHVVVNGNVTATNVTATSALTGATLSTSGTGLVSGVLSAGSGPVALTNASGNILPAAIANGTVTALTVTTLTAPTANITAQNVSGLPTWSMTATDIAVSSPTAAGQWIRTSAWDIYVSSGIGTLTSWKKVTN